MSASTESRAPSNVSVLDYSIALATPRRLTAASTWHDCIPFGMFLVELLRPRLLVELGTQGGDSYCAFCQAVEALQLDTRCYAVDTWRGDAHSGAYGVDVLADLRRHHDSLYGKFSTLLECDFDSAAEQFSDGTIDLLHIDGFHTYEAVCHDFETWLPKVSDAGVVLLHDINIRDREFGVWRLWDELDGRFRRFGLRHGHGLGVVVIGSAVPQDVDRLLLESSETLAHFFAVLGERVELRHDVQSTARSLERQLEIIRVLEAQRDEQNHIIGALQNQVAELHQRLSVAERRAFDAESETAALLSTRTFRYTRQLREKYHALRTAAHAGAPSLCAVSGRVRSLPPRRGVPRPFQEVRQELALQYLKGSGLEIGALHQPLALPPGANVRYVDRLTVDELREHYPELAAYDLVQPDVLDDAERLSTIADGSVDFVIANHFIEHCQDPIEALGNLLRVTRQGGIVYMAVPDKRRIFDRDRPTTSIEHLDRDHRESPAWSKAAHYDEYARLVDHATDPVAHARRLMEQDYSIHFHVWTPPTFREFLDHCLVVHRLLFEVADFVTNDFEFIAILRKGSAP